MNPAQSQQHHPVIQQQQVVEKLISLQLIRVACCLIVSTPGTKPPGSRDTSSNIAGPAAGATIGVLAVIMLVVLAVVIVIVLKR